MTGGGVVKDFAVNDDVLVSRNCRSEDGHVVKTLLIGNINCDNGFYLKIHKSMSLRKQQNKIDSKWDCVVIWQKWLWMNETDT